MNCPKCRSTQIVKYGHTHYGKQHFHLKQHQLTAQAYRQMLHQRIESWRELTSLQAVA